MSTARAAPETPHAKAFRRGTHRVCAPEETLARLRPHLSALGITRVAMLTGLDRVGLPVATAIRPNGRALSISLGKGVTPAAAKVSAIMEAAEAYHAETVTGPLHWARAEELPGAVNPARLPAAAGAMGEDLARARCLWIEGVNLMDGRAAWLPWQLVHADYTIDQAEPLRFQATTSGLAAGNVAVEAQIHALCEVVERDAIACWRAAGGPAAPAARPVAPEAIDDGDIAALIARLRGAGAEVAIWDVTGDVGIPVFLALVLPGKDERDAVEAELGSGCHLDPAVALSRALTEAAQTRLARIAGARDDFEPASYGAEARARRRAEARDWLARARRAPLPWKQAGAGGCWRAGADLDADLSAILAALAAAGFREAVWSDLTRPDPGIPVGRVVVPGLEGPYLPGRYRPGARAGAAARGAPR